MGSADPPLAVHCRYGGRHRQQRRRGTEEVYLLGGPLGGAPARLATVHRSVLVRAAVCHQVGQRATDRLNGRPAARRRPNDDCPEAWGWAAATGVLWGLSHFF